jgi:hypothetical protein
LLYDIAAILRIILNITEVNAKIKINLLYEKVRVYILMIFLKMYLVQKIQDVSFYKQYN